MTNEVDLSYNAPKPTWGILLHSGTGDVPSAAVKGHLNVSHIDVTMQELCSAGKSVSKS